jgi:hypothetical protein
MLPIIYIFNKIMNLFEIRCIKFIRIKFLKKLAIIIGFFIL